MNNDLTFISLFSGIGGMDLGLERAGWSCVGQVELNPKAQAVLARHWPDVPKWSDVRDVGRHNLPPARLLCGGFPCQDVSIAGRRAGLAGKQSGLWFEFHRVLAETTPEWVLIENVAGLLSSNQGRDFAIVLRGLVECGYGVCWRVLDSQYLGVAQRRRRVFIVGHLGSGRAAEVLFERESLPGDTAPRRRTGQETSRSTASGAGSTGESVSAVDVRNLALTDELSGTLQAKEQGYSLNYINPILVGTLGTEMGRNRGLGNANETDLIVYGLSTYETPKFAEGIQPTLTSPSPTGGGQPPAVVITDRMDRWVEDDDKIRAVQNDGKSSTAQEHVYFKPEGITDSLTGAHVAKVITKQVRRLTPTEAERLQSFPDGWTDGQSDSERYRQLGLAVTVNVAEWLGRRIEKAAYKAASSEESNLSHLPLTE